MNVGENSFPKCFVQSGQTRSSGHCRYFLWSYRKLNHSCLTNVWCGVSLKAIKMQKTYFLWYECILLFEEQVLLYSSVNMTSQPNSRLIFQLFQHQQHILLNSGLLISNITGIFYHNVTDLQKTRLVYVKQISDVMLMSHCYCYCIYTENRRKKFPAAFVSRQNHSFLCVKRGNQTLHFS